MSCAAVRALTIVEVGVGVGLAPTVTFWTPAYDVPTETTMVLPCPAFATRVEPGIAAATVLAESAYRGS